VRERIGLHLGEEGKRWRGAEDGEEVGVVDVEGLGSERSEGCVGKQERLGKRGKMVDKGASQSAVLYEGETNRRGDQGVLTVDPFLTVAGKTVGRTANDVGLMI
jgi:hypothetical protein